MGFSIKQIKQLLQPINPKRVLSAQGHSHVAQQDITAHLNRMFGFGGWDKEVKNIELLFEEAGSKAGQWNVAYKALVRLTIKDADGKTVCFYEDGSIGEAQNQKRGAGHDLAYKSAISLSTKRAAKDLGDQFGLSLYNKGQMTAIVGGTLVGLPEEAEEVDVQANVEQVVSLGNDEIDHSPDPADVARDDLRVLCGAKGWDLKAVALKYDGDLKSAKAEDIQAYINLLVTGAVTV